MSLPQILALSLTEIAGDVSLKYYANDHGIKYLFFGIISYIGVIILLIINLQGSTLLLVNNAWDGINSILTTTFAYVFLGERFHNYFQYFGIIFILLGLYLLKIPIKRDHPFHIPSNDNKL
jgi:multidrug transporter EmrE-like cation transporter